MRRQGFTEFKGIMLGGGQVERKPEIWTIEENCLIKRKKPLYQVLGLQADGEKPFVISLVGGGGKTTAGRQLAREFSAAGYKTAFTTSTKIRIPAEGYLSENFASWKKQYPEDYITAGIPWNLQKLTMIQGEQWEELKSWADVIIVEADGARMLPIKLPAAWEPVILKETSVIIGCIGLDCIGKPWKQVCFRWELGKGLNGGEVITPEKAAKIILSEEGLKKGTEGRRYVLLLNKGDTKERLEYGRKILELTQLDGGITSFRRKGQEK